MKAQGWGFTRFFRYILCSQICMHIQTRRQHKDCCCGITMAYFSISKRVLGYSYIQPNTQRMKFSLTPFSSAKVKKKTTVTVFVQFLHFIPVQCENRKRRGSLFAERRKCSRRTKEKKPGMYTRHFVKMLKEGKTLSKWRCMYCTCICQCGRTPTHATRISNVWFNGDVVNIHSSILLFSSEIL